MYDIVILGGGVVGTTIARRLSRYDLKTVLIEKEKDISMGASKANSAIVHGGYAESNETLKGRLCYQGRRQFEDLDKDLNFGFKKIGSMVITTVESDLKHLEKMLKNGVLNGLTDLKILNQEEILKLEPNINKSVKYALYCEGAGICSPYQMAHAMMENAMENGVELELETKVIGIKKMKDYYIIATNNKNIKTRYVINSTGLNSCKTAEMLGESVASISPRSGQYILFNTGSGKYLNHTIFQMPTDKGKGVLVTPTVHGNLLIGPDAIDDEEEKKDTDLVRLKNIYDLALNSFLGLDVNQFIRSFAGVRAVSSTDDFIVEEAKSAKGFINLIGIQSPGLTSSPAISDMVFNILKKSGLEFSEKSDYNPYRKAIIGLNDEKLPLPEVAKLVDKERGDKNRLVCRCEQISEAVMSDALSRGIKFTTIDGMKRRTRAGMGHCQGNFCRPRVEEFMERSLGESLDKHTDCENSKTKRVDRQEFLEYYKKTTL